MSVDQEQQQRFDDWMDAMDSLLEEFMLDLPEETSSKLDGSTESLDVLEAWLLDKYTTHDEIKNDPDVAPLDAATRYFGQILVNELKGKWVMDPDEGVPVIANKGVWIPPMVMIMQAVHARTGTYLRTMTQKNIDYHKANFS